MVCASLSAIFLAEGASAKRLGGQVRLRRRLADGGD